jgi:2-keto-4-pentenoate hydratase/2-oxohepta-3-ene-1,7-dioic acid hydratase in catechol pathway
MRLLHYRQLGSLRLGAALDSPDGGSEVVDLAGARAVIRERSGFCSGFAEVGFARDLPELLALGSIGLDVAREVLAWVADLGSTDRKALQVEQLLVPLDQVQFLPPVSPVSTIYCLGLNYESHAAEAKTTLPEYPEVFLENFMSLTGHCQPLIRPAVSTHLDWQGEMALVIGRPAHRVDPSTALDYVAGYTCFNDGSVRDYQKRGPFPAPGKNFTSAGSAGPWLVTRDEISDPHSLQLTTRIGDDIVQSANTSEMWFSVARIVAYLSEFTILQPGDLIATGTPGGVGICLTPKRFLVPGEVLSVELESVGLLQNPVVDEIDAPSA